MINDKQKIGSPTLIAFLSLITVFGIPRELILSEMQDFSLRTVWQVTLRRPKEK